MSTIVKLVAGIVINLLSHSVSEQSLDITTKEAIQCNETYQAFHHYFLKNEKPQEDEKTYRVDQKM